jgi:hypothetical protein
MTRISCGSSTGLILRLCVPPNGLAGLRRAVETLLSDPNRTDAGAGASGQAGQAGPHPYSHK